MSCGLRSLRWAWFGIAVALLALAPAVRAATAPGFSVADVQCREGSTACVVTIVKSAKASSYSKVTVATVGATAQPGSDFGSVSTTITFGNKQLSAAVIVSIFDDVAVEGNETLGVKLTAVRFATIKRSPATVTILDNDVAAPPPPVQCPDGTTVPAGQTCPTAPPPPPPTVSACKALSMVDADHPLPYADMLCTAIKTCHDYRIGLVPYVGDPLVEQGKRYYVVRGGLWHMDDSKVVAWPTSLPEPGQGIRWPDGMTGGAFFDRSCFE